ncbi:MAG: dihydroorotase [Proteobacteria bacterium]|nr:dihydroorotase [Pseudomonadota bacterium]
MPANPAPLRILQPDDWHLHLRDGASLAAVVGATARIFARAIVMPNLKPPVTTVAAARAYRDRIVAALPPDASFVPLMTLYLTETLAAAEIERARDSGFVHAIKYYPAGATTNSESGVTAIERAYPALEAMERAGVVLCVHGEVTDPDVDVFDRERVFIERHLSGVVARFPELRIVVEHLTTRDGVDFVRACGPHVAATLTPQHLLYSRNALFGGGFLRPHVYCLPVLKRETHRQALVAAATSGSPKFFLGTDSAPHARGAKENACGCAGCYSAPSALELYAEVFEGAGALDKLEGFASLHGPDFYRLPRNTGHVTLSRRDHVVPAELPFGDTTIVPLRAGETLRWQATLGSDPIFQPPPGN